MKKTEYEFPSAKNALPMHRYVPHKLKYQIVIDVVEEHEIGKNECGEAYFVYKITRKNDDTNHIRYVESFKKETTIPEFYESETGEMNEDYSLFWNHDEIGWVEPILKSDIIEEWGKE